MSPLVAIILLVVFVALVVLVVTQSIRIVPQAMAGARPAHPAPGPIRSA